MFPEELIDHIEYLVSQDETELALKCFDMVPAFFRDQRSEKLLKLKAEIQKQILLPVELQHDYREMPKSNEHSVQFLRGTARGSVLLDQVTAANKNNIRPHLFDFGPGDFTFPLGLSALGYDFLYTPFTLHANASKDTKARLGPAFWDDYKQASPNSPRWFVAYEIIEHLADPTEIAQLMLRLGDVEKIFLSTPKYTYAQGTPNWRVDGIHHRRAYTPKEFIEESIAMFPMYSFEFFDNEVMVLLGSKK